MANKSHSYRKQAAGILARIREYNADYDQLLVNLDDISKKCMSGIEQEKLSVKDGVLPVIEKYANVAVQAELGKFSIVKELTRLADLDEVDTQISVSIVLGSLEATLESQDS